MADKKISSLAGAITPLAGTEILPIVQSGATVKVATDDLTVKNFRSNASTGILQVTGPASASTCTMTVPNTNFTVARTDAAQTFTGDQTFSGNLSAATLTSYKGSTAYPTGGVATTIFTMPADGLYAVYFYLAGAGDEQYSSFTYAVKSGSSTRLFATNNGALLTITLSGSNIQATHAVSGFAVSYAIQRIF